MHFFYLITHNKIILPFNMNLKDQMKLIARASFFFVLLLFFNILNAQNIHCKINWKPAQTYHFNELKSIKFLSFDNALYPDEENIPHFIHRSLYNSGICPAISLSDIVTENAGDDEISILSETKNVPEEFSVVANISYENKKPYLLVDIIPVRKNKITGSFEKLVSFNITTTGAKAGNKEVNLKSWPWVSNSVLKSGNWHKILTYQSGIHVITYEDLVDLYINPSDIDPRNIRLYGNGGDMLPENNAVFRHDDLYENAIYVQGESDGRFDQDDYILFYSKGPCKWTYDSANNFYSHQLNKFTVSTAYFLTTSLSPGKRITVAASLSDPADYTVTSFDDYKYHEKDSLNLIKSGREFYGEVFDVRTSYTFNFDLPNIVTGSDIKIKTSVLARSVGYETSFRVYSGSSQVLYVTIPACSPDYTSSYARITSGSASFISGNPVVLRFDYNKNGNSSASGWLDYIELNCRRYLSFVSGQLAFRDASSIGMGVSEFIIGNANPAMQLWDITNPLDPVKINGNLSGSNYSFKIRTDSLKEFVAWDNNGYISVTTAGSIANQNIHGLGQQDMLIVTYPDFASQANRLADFHRIRDNMTVAVVTPQQIYNEYSSGNQDITAIKGFVKMFYDRAGSDPNLQPKFLLLFGDASYDYLNRVANNTNFVPTYQTYNSLDPVSSFLTDDYVGFLDDHESGPYGNSLDISIGRIPVKTSEEAKNVVDKILNYNALTDLSITSGGCNAANNIISNFADWRNIICFVADDTDKPGEDFLNESEFIAKRIDTLYPVYNLDKIYLDAYPQISTPGGQRYPAANSAIVKRVEKGALIVNYIGHGGEVGWSHEGVLSVADINAWTNHYNLPFFVTATCEFSRFDDPDRTAAGELVFLSPAGGGIGLFTTTRLAFSGSNFSLNNAFYNYILKKTSNEFPFVGDVIKKSKNDYGCSSVISNFVLLGDPAMKLAYPRNNIITTTINTHTVAGLQDTMKALAKIHIGGYIADVNGIKINDFNGILYPTVFDKAAEVASYGNDAGYVHKFLVRKNIVYKGKASVTDGNFGFSFVVPKDIAYAFGKGKLSFYAQNGNTDANGYYNDFIMGGSENYEITDNNGPEIRLFLNDERFVSGGTTNENPLLIARLADTAGLNTVGNAIGHDLSAVLDLNTENTIVLNDYFESDLNTYQSGMVRYPFSKISSGTHKLLMKAWDVYNNSSETEIEFVVAETADLALTHVLNYPNPFTTYTEFWFEHNQPCCGLDVQVQIFTVSGKLIKTIDAYVETNGFRADPIPWDGRDDYGDNIGKGVYIYILKVKGSTGKYAEKIEKLVILK